MQALGAACRRWGQHAGKRPTTGGQGMALHSQGSRKQQMVGPSPSRLPIPSALTSAEAEGGLSDTLPCDLGLARARSAPLLRHGGF